MPFVGVDTTVLLALSSAITGSLGGTVNSIAVGLIDIAVAITPAVLVTRRSILDGTTPALTVPSITDTISVHIVNTAPLNAEVTIDPIMSPFTTDEGLIVVPRLLIDPIDPVSALAELAV